MMLVVAREPSARGQRSLSNRGQATGECCMFNEREFRN